MEIPIQDVRTSGVLPEKVEFQLHATLESGLNGRLSRFELLLNHKRAAVPVDRLRRLPLPNLNHVGIGYVVPGFTGVIAKSIDPSVDIREHVLVTLPYGDFVACIDADDASESGMYSNYYMSFALDGSLIDSEDVGACEACSMTGGRCELDSLPGNHDSADSN